VPATSPAPGGDGTQSVAKVMDPAPLEKIVRHDGRMNVLRCLWDGEPSSVPEIAHRIGETPQRVRYWIGLLDAFQLLERKGGFVNGEPTYVVTLDNHPEWVREAVRDHDLKT
jgi:hypothetical protein